MLESLGKLLIVQEVVDRNALTQLLGTTVSKETLDAPGVSERAEEAGGAVKPLMTPSYNGGQTTGGRRGDGLTGQS